MLENYHQIPTLSVLPQDFILSFRWSETLTLPAKSLGSEMGLEIRNLFQVKYIKIAK